MSFVLRRSTRRRMSVQPSTQRTQQLTMPKIQSYEAEAQQKIRALEAEVQRLTELPKMVLIFPGDRVITLPDVTRPKLRKLLIDYDIADTETYCKLFGTDTTLLLNRVD